MTVPDAAAISRTSAALRAMALRREDAVLLAIYPLCFALLHWAARPWAGAGFFSLWYPAAGLRFALLWSRGARMTPWLILTEVISDGFVGLIPSSGPAAVQAITGAIRPGLTCGLAIAAVRRLARSRSDALALPPMMLGLAAVAAPTFNAVMVVPFEAWLPSDASYYRSGVDVAISLTGLAVGDLLGILVFAPLLLWLCTVLEGIPALRLSAFNPSPHLRPLAEDALVFALCLMLTIALWRAGLGAQPIPSLLGGAWIGLRHGRTAAWFAICAQVCVFLPYSAGSLADDRRLELHLGLAAVVLVTWLAGSFSDAQKTSRALLERRNRLLFQAERLKTLRAMSVAVIHEISQPLSTLAIEAAHLKTVTRHLDADTVASATLVDRKARALSDLVRRLRRFGGRDVDEPSPLPVEVLVLTACQIVAPEARVAGGSVDCVPVAADLVVQVQEIELTQALVNLLRNALAASPGQVVRVAVIPHADEVAIEVSNPAPAAPGTFPGGTGTGIGAGMGVGLVIARTIVEAHGGTLTRRDEAGLVRFIISLPLLTGAFA
ncbi:ATP-binding protein [Novosphingobium sp. AP12]|uniref:ATP-binding protein n=1 Tax=Novosphingobium sp. AP12 TaxID=1144305 RepID=UPI000272198B|nr:ATP-binding protein [Novosphingobium sp. AP12]EJL33750.1 histidine kinase [Novosphingobium sp. AP12]